MYICTYVCNHEKKCPPAHHNSFVATHAFMCPSPKCMCCTKPL